MFRRSLKKKKKATKNPDPCSSHVKSGMKPSKGRKLKLKAILTRAIRGGGGWVGWKHDMPQSDLKVIAADEIQALNTVPKAGNKIAILRPPIQPGVAAFCRHEYNKHRLLGIVQRYQGVRLQRAAGHV